MSQNIETGTGKTLAFALPLVERLLQAGREHRGRGRSPRVLVMCPTRELARQIASEFASICDSQGLAVLAVYGGSPFGPQESAFRMGVDIVVGTPGRLLDHMSRGTLKLEEIRSFVMDEADMMLDMGFVEDMDEVLNAVKKARNSSDPLQTLLFSATFPEWVKKTSDRFLRRSETTTIDLVGNDDAKMADTIRHYAIPIAPSGQQDALMARTQTLADAIRAFSKKDRTLVFTSTKREVDLIVEALQGRFANTIGCRAAGLHGDVDQSRREHILAAFRSGSVPVLVATDVAARGLDIPATNLVVHFTPPTNQESFIHRSGRTGRANQAGTSITLFTPRGPEEYAVKDLAKFAGITFTQTVVQPRDIIAEVAREAMDKIYKVPAHVVKSYEPFARKLLEEKAEGDPVRAVAMAVAAVVETSHHHVQGAKHTPAGPVHTRGVLSGREGFTCLMAVNCHSESELRAALDNAELPATVRNAILSSAMLSLRNRSVEGVVMEVPSDDAELVIQKLEELEVEEVEEVTCELRPLIRGGYKDSGDYGYGRRGGSRYGDDRGYRRDRGYGKDRDYGRDRDYRSRDRDRGGFRSAKTDFGSRTSVRWMSIYSRMA